MDPTHPNSGYLPILVTGGSGQLAGLIMQELISRGVPPDQIITTTRTPGNLTELARIGVQVREADFKKPESLTNAFEGAARMLIISTVPDLPFVNGNRVIQHRAAIDAAVRSGVPHLFYTSAPNPEPRGPVFWKQDHYETEIALIHSGVDWTVLRQWEWPDWHLDMDFTMAVETGVFATSRGGGCVNHVTRDDCARAIAGALLREDAANRIYDLTGPESLNALEIARLLTEVSGREVRYTSRTELELEEVYVRWGIDSVVIPFLVGFSEGVRHGRYDGTTNWVEQLSGKKPASLREFLTGKLSRSNR